MLSADEQLDLYVTRADELTQTRLLRNGFAPGITLSWNAMEGLRFSHKEPDEEELRSFLLTFRQFTLNDEPIFVDSVYNLCHQLITSEELRGRLARSRAAWRKASRSYGFKFVLDGQEITPGHAADLWINGHYFHMDESKMRALRQLVPPAHLAVRFHFLNFLVDATRQVLYVANVIRVAQREGLVAGP